MKKYQIFAALFLVMMLAFVLVLNNYSWEIQLYVESLQELVGHLVWSG